MQIAIMIHTHDEWASANNEALQLAASIQNSSHELAAVFFYGTAAHIVADQNAMANWTKAKIQCHKWVCRTMIDEFQIPTTQTTPEAGFEVVGLASWLKAVEDAQRVVNLG